MFMNRQIFLWIIFLVLSAMDARSVNISGHAEGRSSGTIYAYRYADALTSQRAILAESEIDASGHFQLSFHCDETRQIFLSINRVSASLYVHPNEVYSVVFPDESRIAYRSFANSRVGLTIEPKNNLTDSLWRIDTAIAAFVNTHFFNYAYQQFRGPESYLEEARKRSPHADLFKRSAQSDSTSDVDVLSIVSAFQKFSSELMARYDSRSSQYSQQYLRYSLAELELMTLPAFSSYFYRHFSNDSMQLLNTAYVRTFRAFFQGFLDKHSDELPVGWSDNFNQLCNALKGLLPDGTKELYAGIWILHLLETRDAWEDVTQGRNLMLEEISNHFESSVPIQAAVSGLKRQASFIAPGRYVQSFRLTDGMGERWQLDDEGTGYKYFLFFAQWNTESVKEIRLLERLSERMKGLMKIYAVCCDADYGAFKKFLSTSANSYIEFLYAGCNPEVDDVCGLKLIPDAMLLNPENRTMMPHAPLPSGRLEEYFKKITDEMKKPGKTRKTWKD